jgi:succinoglycan biosynthesis protein ExoA
VISVQVVRRRKSLCGLFAGPAALVMHVAWAFGFAEGLIRIRERPWQGATA